MKKRGQFYLLSAIVIIALIIGFSAVSTYTKKGGDVRVFDLGEELEIESANVLDYGTYPSNSADITSKGGLDSFLTEFVDDYAEYIGEDKEIAFVFGNPEEENVTVVNYEEEEVGSVSDISSTTFTIWFGEPTTQPIEEEGEERVTVIRFKDQEYRVVLKPGENFFFVISQNVEGETHVTSSENIE